METQRIRNELRKRIDTLNIEVCQVVENIIEVVVSKDGAHASYRNTTSHFLLAKSDEFAEIAYRLVVLWAKERYLRQGNND